jgi:hypothetical protein
VTSWHAQGLYIYYLVFGFDSPPPPAPPSHTTLSTVANGNWDGIVGIMGGSGLVGLGLGSQQSKEVFHFCRTADNIVANIASYSLGTRVYSWGKASGV